MKIFRSILHLLLRLHKIRDAPYLKEQRPYLLAYLEDGRLELSNNRAERSIKPFVIDGRAEKVV